MPTCIKCEKVMKSGYKKIKVLKDIRNNIWVCEYECKDGCVVEPVEPDYRNSEEYKQYEWCSRQTNIPDAEKISLFGITMLNMFRREMAKMREENGKLKTELRVLKNEEDYSVGAICWENMTLNQGWYSLLV
jgi:hypothetical protein